MKQRTIIYLYINTFTVPLNDSVLFLVLLLLVVVVMVVVVTVVVVASVTVRDCVCVRERGRQ